MILVTIGEVTKSIDDAKPDWINQTINGMRRDGLPVCVQVKIEGNPVNLYLSSPGCGGGKGGGGRSPNPEEQKILSLWEKHRLNTNDFPGGGLVAFLKNIT